jgi:hypothetical protein
MSGQFVIDSKLLWKSGIVTDRSEWMAKEVIAGRKPCTKATITQRIDDVGRENRWEIVPEHRSDDPRLKNPITR